MKNIRLRKIFAILLGMVIILTALANTFKVNAAGELPETLYVRLSRVIPSTNIGYAIGNPTVSTGEGKTIWNLVSYTDNTFTNINDFSKTNLYCLKAGAGFHNRGDGEKAIYTKLCSINDKVTMNNNASAHKYVGELANNPNYNSIRWIIDNMYIKGESKEQDKINLLEKVGIAKEEDHYAYYDDGEYRFTSDAEILEYKEIISDNDLMAIQQAALWYFTNVSDYEATNEPYNKFNTKHWEYITEDGGNTYTELSSKPDGREELSRILYKYFIQAAKDNKDYPVKANQAPVTINKDSATISKNGDKYLVGPISITKNNDISRNIEVSVLDQNDKSTNYKYTNSSGTEISGFNINTYIGDFYISVPISEATKVKVKFNLKYQQRDAYIYVENGNTVDQPIVLPQTEEKSIPVEFELIAPELIPVSVEKVWNDNNNSENKRPVSIDVQLYKNGTSMGNTYKVKLNQANEWKYTWENLPKYENGTEIKYTVKELKADGTVVEANQKYDGNYTVSYSTTDNKTTVTNTTSSGKGKYDLVLVKEDESGVQLNSKATFEVNGVEKEVIGQLEIAKDVPITDDNLTKVDTYVIKETKAPDEYCEFDGIITITVTKKKENDEYKIDKVTYKVTDSDGNDITEETGDKVNVYLNSDGNIYAKVKNYQFDLKLIKRIVKVNDKEVKERLLNVDVSKLNKKGEDGKVVTTADYKMTKDPVLVKNGDIVTYTFRVYNEGYVDGYASEITEDIPEGLEFIWSDKIGENLKNDTTLTEAEKKAIEFNQSMLWKYTDTSLKTISTTYLSKDNGEDKLIKAFGENDGNKTAENLDYKEVSVMLKVTAKNSFDGILRNEAEISEDTDSKGEDVDDRDSDTEKWGKENSDKYYDDDKKWPTYKEDDECYDNIKLQYFDLALRKFITAVEDEAVTSRIPVVTYKDEKIVYTHPKNPLTVKVGDVVTYTIRVFNEGKIDGYAEKVTDDIPEYLEYLPNHKINKEYRWVMEDKEGKTVEKASQANKVTTDYLSSAQEKETKRDNLLKAFDSSKEISETNPDYRDLKIAFKVKDPNSNTYIITNHAQISEDSDDDIDSTPDEWNEGEDDQDVEHVKVQYFDLALRKYVTQAIVIENGKKSVKNTGHKAEDDPEAIVKVELHRKKLSSVVVKFKYKIKITNEGDIEGYAKEITDYIPAGLKFEAKDNPKWKDEGNNIISTRQLENKLLQPGESTEVEVILTWINGANNTGLKVNTAEISEDWNKPGIPDRDSTPDNKKPGEDDIDDAPVMLSIETGQIRIYYALGTTILAILAGGIFLIRKYVL